MSNDTFFCSDCRHHKPVAQLGKAKRNRKLCLTCVERANAAANRKPDDVVGAFPDGTDKLRKYNDHAKDNAVKGQYTSGKLPDWMYT